MRVLLQKQLSTALLRLVDELSMVYAGSHHTHSTSHGSGQGKSDMISPVSVAAAHYDSNSVFPFQAGTFDRQYRMCTILCTLFIPYILCIYRNTSMYTYLHIYIHYTCTQVLTST